MLKLSMIRHGMNIIVKIQKPKKIEESGGTPEYPVAPSNAEYYVIYEDLVEVPGGTYRVSLEEGQILELDDWCDNVSITISKNSGLFME